MDAIKECKFMNYHITLYVNRIEIEQNIFPFGKKKEIILLRNITEIIKKIGRPLAVKTNDGKSHTIPVGSVKAINEWQDAIASAL
jgi:hypothetical protein